MCNKIKNYKITTNPVTHGEEASLWPLQVSWFIADPIMISISRHFNAYSHCITWNYTLTSFCDKMIRVLRSDAVSSHNILYVDDSCLKYGISTCLHCCTVLHTHLWLVATMLPVCRLRNSDWIIHAFTNHLTGVLSC